MSQPPRDPAIEEIREVRHRISARFGHDPKRLIAHYIEYQKQFQDRLIKSPKSGEDAAAPAVPKGGRH